MRAADTRAQSNCKENRTMSDTTTETTAKQLTSAIREHHRALATTLESFASDIESLEASEERDVAGLATLLDAVTSFLSGELMPHAQGEERTLYPALDPILRAHGRPTATMSIDHEYLGQHAQQIAALANQLRSADASQRATLTRQLQREVIQLQGLFRVHLAKEERVYLPLIDEVVTDGDQQALLAALHAEAEEAAAPQQAPEAMDVRSLPPMRRHEVIFERFDALTAGESFILVNDHDPKPLRYQLVAEYPGELLWEYLEQGPEVWRVRMGKVS
jgi:uncharacterized protein (DUF2249 family)/hemerythrin-like domain-containing protein